MAGAAEGMLAAHRGLAAPTKLAAGIQLYMVGKPFAEDPAGTLQALHKIGYREVETSVSPKLSAKDQKKLFDDAGVTCPSMHLQFMAGTMEAGFEDAHALGAHYVVSSVLREFPPEIIKAFSSGGPMPELPPMGVEGFKKTAAQMNDVGKKAKAAGLQYAYHNHNFEFEKMPDGTPGYDILLKESDPELVKFELDCGWMSVAGYDPVAYFKKHPGRFRMLHIKDFTADSRPTIDLTGPKRPKGADLGTGFVDYAPIFAAAKSAGIEHVFAEQEAPFAVSQMESAKVDYAYMHKFV